MRTALACLVLLSASTAFADDPMLATVDMGSGDVAVYRIKPTGIDKVYVEKGKYSALGWSDPKTLWLFDRSDEVAKMVDGKIVERITVPVETFKLPKGTDLDTRMQITSKGEVWLVHCLKPKRDVGDDQYRCVKGSWVRVDGKTRTQTTKQPAGVDDYRSTSTPLGVPPPFPKIKAPAGYTVTLQNVVADGLGDDQKKMKVKGAVCKGPSSSKTFPEGTSDIPYDMKPAKVTWVRAQPAVALIEGKATNPIGEIESHRAAFVDCKELYADAIWIGGGAWGLEKDQKLTIYVEDKRLGTIDAPEYRAAPSK